MKALQFRKSIPRYILLKLAGPRLRRLYTSSASPVAYRDIQEPKLPTQSWVRIRPTLAGVCGSDLSTICAKGSPYLAPVTSMPFVMGHEMVGRVVEVGADVDNVSVGARAVLHPALGCHVRGIEPKCDACQKGRDALCSNITRGCISAGIQSGFCRDTGGGFSTSMVAHHSQVYAVPEDLPDEQAVLVEPFACALHGILRVSLEANQSALVLGCGSIGLLTIAALRATGCKARIVASGRYDHQISLGNSLGVDEWIPSGGGTVDRYKKWASVLNAQVLQAELGKPMVIGGADATFDCVGSSHTIDDGIRFTKSGGTFVLVGMPGAPRGVDWTPLWFKELTLCATYAYGPERWAGGQRDTFDLAIDLMKTWGPKLVKLVGPAFALRDYQAAIRSALHTGRTGVAKTIFRIDET